MKLTDKQIKARAYYAENAERIKAQKRAQYLNKQKSETGIPKAIPFMAASNKRKPTPPVAVKQIKPIKPAEPNAELNLSPQEQIAPRELTARQKLENMRIDREAGLDGLGEWD